MPVRGGDPVHAAPLAVVTDRPAAIGRVQVVTQAPPALHADVGRAQAPVTTIARHQSTSSLTRVTMSIAVQRPTSSPVQLPTWRSRLILDSSSPKRSIHMLPSRLNSSVCQ